MLSIESIEQYSNLVKQIRKQLGKVETNCFLMPNEIEYFIDQKKLYYILLENELDIYCEDSEFFHLYYYMGKGSTPKIKQALNKPIILDFVLRRHQVESFELKDTGKWNEAGFVFYKEYERMKLDGKEFDRYLDENKAEDSLMLCEKGDRTIAQSILELWENGLDIYSTRLPSLEELEERMQQGSILYIRDENGTLYGAVQLLLNGKHAIIQHVCVNPSYQKRGLGRKLMCGALNKMKALDIDSCLLWVDIKNVFAINLYLRFGFTEDGIISKQFMKKRGI